MRFTGEPAPLRARLVWVSPSGDPPDRGLRQAMDTAGFELVPSSSDRRAELALIDFRTRSISAPATRRLASVARARSPFGAIIYLAPANLDAARRRHLRRSGAVAYCGDQPALLIEFCRQRIRTNRLAEEVGERIKSLASAGEILTPINMNAPAPGDNGARRRLLVAGSPSPFLLSLISRSKDAGYAVTGVMTAAQAINAIETCEFDAAIFAPEAPSDPLLSLSSSLRRHSSESALPVLIVTSDDQKISQRHIFSGHVEEDLRDRLDDMIARNRQEAALLHMARAYLSPTETPLGAPVATPQFFARHTARLYARAEDRDRPISIVGVRLDAPIFERASASDQLAPLARACTLIARVRRAEDLLARIAPTTFLVLTPGVSVDDAQRIGERIRGVIQSVMFEASPAKAPHSNVFAISAHSTAVQRLSGEHVEESVARLIKGLDVGAAKTRRQVGPGAF